MVVGMLGVLKAGGAYVPLDPIHPTQRLAYTLADAQPAVLVTHRAVAVETTATWLTCGRDRRRRASGDSAAGAGDGS